MKLPTLPPIHRMLQPPHGVSSVKWNFGYHCKSSKRKLPDEYSKKGMTFDHETTFTLFYIFVGCIDEEYGRVPIINGIGGGKIPFLTKFRNL